MQLLVGTIVVIFLLLQLRRTVVPSLISPVYALVCAYMLIFPLGAFLYNPRYGGSGVTIEASVSDLLQTTGQAFWILSGFVAGVLVSAAFAPRSAVLRLHSSSMEAMELTKPQALAAIGMGMLTVLFTVVGVGPANLWRRNDYLLFQFQIATILAGVLSIASAFVLGVVAAQRQKTYRLTAVRLLWVMVLLMAAVATRRFALLLILFCLGRVIAAPAKRQYRRILIACLIATPFLTVVPLVSRQMPTQGLSTLHEIPAEMAKLDWAAEGPTLLNNVLISVPVTYVSAESTHDDAIGYVLLSLNPLPGIMTDWYSEEVRINVATPYNALGDLLRAGLWVAVGYFFVVGFYFCRLELRVKLSRRIPPGLLVLVAISFLFVLMSLQYPLRTISRLLYYMFLIDACGRIWGAIQSHRMRKRLRKALRSQQTRSSMQCLCDPHPTES